MVGGKGGGWEGGWRVMCDGPPMMVVVVELPTEASWHTATITRSLLIALSFSRFTGGDLRAGLGVTPWVDLEPRLGLLSPSSPTLQLGSGLLPPKHELQFSCRARAA